MTATATETCRSLLGLDPSSYRPHPVHLPPRAYVETNCYTDIIVELLRSGTGDPVESAVDQGVIR